MIEQVNETFKPRFVNNDREVVSASGYRAEGDGKDIIDEIHHMGEVLINAIELIDRKDIDVMAVLTAIDVTNRRRELTESLRTLKMEMGFLRGEDSPYLTVKRGPFYMKGNN